MSLNEKHFLEIIRLEDSPTYGTFGVLKLNSQLFCCTLEGSWKGNSGKSCLHIGNYDCERYFSGNIGSTFKINSCRKEPCYFLPANFQKEIPGGCIALGERFGLVGSSSMMGVANSSYSVERFIIALKGVDSFALSIRNAMTP